MQERLVATNPGDERAVSMLSICYSELGVQLKSQGKHDEAVEAISKAAATIEGRAKAGTNASRFQAQLRLLRSADRPNTHDCRPG